MFLFDEILPLNSDSTFRLCRNETENLAIVIGERLLFSVVRPNDDR